MQIKIDKADRAFSLYIRELADWYCERCGRQHERGSQGLHCSHYFGRQFEATRFYPDNADSLCRGCHGYFESDKEEYKQFKINKIGEKRYDALCLKRYGASKKDRSMAYIIWRKAYHDLCHEKGEIPRKI